MQKMPKENISLITSQFSKSCAMKSINFPAAPSFTMVIFGGAGDLSKRLLMPALYHLFQGKRLQKFSILALGRSPITHVEYRGLLADWLKKFSKITLDKKTWDAFSKHLFYAPLDVTDANSYTALCERLNEFSEKNQSKHILYYLAVPPGLTPLIIDNLAHKDLCYDRQNTKVIVEKPFGKNQKSAQKLNQKLQQALTEKQIYRIDHFLGKETVQNILFLRFANTIFEPLWNRNYIEQVEINVAETLGVEHRALFYEEAGVIRDMVQNHLLQLLAIVAMEPPVGFAAEFIRDEKIKVLRAIRAMDKNYIKNNTVIGQYESGKIANKKVLAYRQEKGVAVNSQTATYFAGKFYIDNWRWEGVPFYLKTGKRLAKKLTEIVITFKKPPLKLFGADCAIKKPNTLTLTIQPEEKINLDFSIKYPGTINQAQEVSALFDYSKMFKVVSYSPYERLLLDCLKGDQTLFARQDGVEAMWAIVDPIIEFWQKFGLTKKIPLYAAGSLGPEEAIRLMQNSKFVIPT